MSELSKLQVFLYLLMRDDVVPGDVATTVRNAEMCSGPAVFTNKHLAAYAKELAERLT